MTPKRKTQDDQTIRYLDQTQVQRLFKSIPKDAIRDRLLFAFAYRFGMRTQELIDLPAGAVDRKKWEITIRGAKGGLTRTYTIPRDLRPLVRSWKPAGETFFHGRQGPLSRVRVWQLFKRYAKAARIPEGYGVHSLRHSAAVHALDAGLATEDVRDLLRHRRLATSDIYSNLSVRRRQDYLGKLERSSSVVKLTK